MEINSLNELIVSVREHWELGYRRTTFFRGHAKRDWELKPSCSREPHNRHSDEEIFLTWLCESIPFLDDYIKTRMPEALATAQHHGLPTRLLDWTFSPLVAAYFACKEHQDSDASIWIFKKHSPDNYITKGMMTHNKSININGKDRELVTFIPAHVNSRLRAQNGLFTLHFEPNKNFEDLIEKDDELVELIIPANAKKNILLDLDMCGISAKTLFPDLDGVSKGINELNHLFASVY